MWAPRRTIGLWHSNGQMLPGETSARTRKGLAVSLDVQILTLFNVAEGTSKEDPRHNPAISCVEK
jgi:hypothetical protein